MRVCFRLLPLGLAVAIGAVSAAGAADPRQAAPVAAPAPARVDDTRAAELFAAAERQARSGERMPALLVFLRGLAIDAESPRARGAAEAARRLLTQGVSEEDDGGVTISITPGGLDDGLAPLDLALSLSVAAWRQDDNRGKPEAVLVAETLATVLAVAEESGADRRAGCDVCARELPFFVALARAGHADAFGYVAFSSLRLPGSQSWLGQNTARVEALQRWLAEHSAK